MDKILILGHTGMLGNAVYKYFLENEKDNYTVFTMPDDYRFEKESLLEALANTNPTWVINCMGKIPQRSSILRTELYDYVNINISVPLLVRDFNSNIRLIHASSDCEFSGNLPSPYTYHVDSIPDAVTPYGISKYTATRLLMSCNAFNTCVIRTSIIGHSPGNKGLGLLDWVLSNKEKAVPGYANHLWNGITTLEWAKIAMEVYKARKDYERSLSAIIQPGSEAISKYQLLRKISKVYELNKNIVEASANDTVNRCLNTTELRKPIEIQLEELKTFYNYE